jgi:hypothetical protein
MHIFTGVRYGTEVERTLRRFVTCQQCRCAYTWTATAVGTGRGFAPLGVDADGARQEATDDAVRAAHGLLLSEPVRCPNCGWYQDYMVRELKRRKLAALAAAAKLALAAAVPVPLIVVRALGRGDLAEGFERQPLLWWCMIGLPVAAAAALLLRRRVVATYDPNSAFPAFPPPRPGEPEAMVEEPAA